MKTTNRELTAEERADPEIPEGFFLLRPGTIIEEGDWYWTSDNKWEPIIFAGVPTVYPDVRFIRKTDRPNR